MSRELMWRWMITMVVASVTSIMVWAWGPTMDILLAASGWAIITYQVVKEVQKHGQG